LIATDIFDFFGTGAHHSVPLFRQAGWGSFWVYAYGKIALELVLMMVAGFIIYRLHSIVRDVRNLLMLIEWTPGALYPVLYRLFNAGKSPLLKGANETSYDEYGDGFFCLRIRLTFPRDPSDPKAAESTERVFYTKVNLWKSASHKSGFENKVDGKQLFTEAEWVRSLAEERRMRVFFFNILTNPSVERELCHEFWKIARERNVTGEWMNVCKKEFTKPHSKRLATTDEIVKGLPL
jgi:hypothetical protein